MAANQKKYEELRKEFPSFSFEGYDLNRQGKALSVVYHFDLSGKVRFQPQFSIEIQSTWLNQLPDPLLHNLIFHIGMAEMISYWKATCSPLIEIKVFGLEPDALEWWKRLFYLGLGEFFYTNGIRADFNDFLSFNSNAGSNHDLYQPDLSDSCLIPVGGGKDSAVTLEILRQSGKRIIPFLLNPTTAALEVLKVAGFEKEQAFIINRTLDPQLLRLNEQGFLNGHTPFSALLAFYSLIPAVLTGSKHIVLSNESSANEPTIPGTNINHQYSKSFAFEKDFREYCRNYISDAFNYFSFLRPINELQIGALFSGFGQYHQAFRSCNAGSKTGIWCGKCPKCLFTFIILSPFLEPANMLEIFGSNLLDDPELAFYFDQLCGVEEEKPFDCIGTVDEVNAALNMTLLKYDPDKLPALLQRFRNAEYYQQVQEIKQYALLSQFEPRHFLSEEFAGILKSRLRERISE